MNTFKKWMILISMAMILVMATACGNKKDGNSATDTGRLQTETANTENTVSESHADETIVNESK